MCIYTHIYKYIHIIHTFINIYIYSPEQISSFLFPIFWVLLFFFSLARVIACVVPLGRRLGRCRTTGCCGSIWCSLAGSGLLSRNTTLWIGTCRGSRTISRGTRSGTISIRRRLCTVRGGGRSPRDWCIRVGCGRTGGWRVRAGRRRVGSRGVRARGAGRGSCRIGAARNGRTSGCLLASGSRCSWCCSGTRRVRLIRIIRSGWRCSGCAHRLGCRCVRGKRGRLSTGRLRIFTATEPTRCLATCQ